MKRVICVAAAVLLAASVFGQAIPKDRDLFVGVWKFAEENNYQNVSKYSKQLESFLKKEWMNDIINAPMNSTGVKKSFNFEKGNCFDIIDDEYRILTPQVDKALLGATLHIFDWTIKNDNGNLSLKLNNAITAIVDKNGEWTSTSEFKKSKIMNGKQIEKLASADVMKYLMVSDEEYAKSKKEVAANLGFLLSIIPNTTELALDGLIEENDVYNTETKIDLKVFSVKKNDSKITGFTPDVYAYQIYGTNGEAYLWGYSNKTVFNKAKKDSDFSCSGKIKSIKYELLKAKIIFVVE
ncbi:MAG: hypothetical protein IK015_06255 [Treponema sp.]|nr:hypothetical protein [Treponema sp.]